MDKDLQVNFENTTFQAETPLGVVKLRIGVSNPTLSQLLTRFAVDEWAYITAYNPGAQPTSEEENAQKQNELKEWLARQSFLTFDGEGIGDNKDWPPEPSLLVLGIKRQLAVDLGLKYRQVAIVAGSKDAIPRLVECEKTVDAVEE